MPPPVIRFGFGLTNRQRLCCHHYWAPRTCYACGTSPECLRKLAKPNQIGQIALATLKPFVGKDLTDIEGADWFVARTGYTGEDGVEVILQAQASAFFTQDHGYPPARIRCPWYICVLKPVWICMVIDWNHQSRYECEYGMDVSGKDDFLGHWGYANKQDQALLRVMTSCKWSLVLESRGIYCVKAWRSR